MSDAASDREIEALQQMAITAGEKAQLPTDREVPGIYHGEGDWMGGFPSIRCRLFGHSERRLPLLDGTQETIGLAVTCDRCWRIQRTEVIEA